MKERGSLGDRASLPVCPLVAGLTACWLSRSERELAWILLHEVLVVVLVIQRVLQRLLTRMAGALAGSFGVLRG
jgi:hypothetical protein